MVSFLRIDGREIDLSSARMLWYPAQSDEGEGLAFNIAAMGRRRLLHLVGWAPGHEPQDLSGRELTITAAGPDAALDGRMFRVLLVRFGRVTEDLAVLSLDGEIEGIDADSDARMQIAADVVCRVAAIDEPAYCLRCGTTLTDTTHEHTNFIGGRRITSRRTSPTCPACTGMLEPPVRCSACGDPYAPEQVEWASDEQSLAYTCTCPNGHSVSGTLRAA